MSCRAGLLVLALLLVAAPCAAGPSGVDDAILGLFRAAAAGNEPATMKAAQAVVAFGPEAASRIVESLPGRSSVEIVWALRCLREIGSENAAQTAFSLCSHGDAAVRADAVWAAWVLGGEAAVPHLQKAASDSDDVVRRRAFDGLLEHGALTAGTLQIAANGVTDKDFWVVMQAFQILDRQRKPERGPDPVLVELAKIVSRLDERNSDAYFEFLVGRSGMDCGYVIEGALSSNRSCVVISALKAAGTLRLALVVTATSRLASCNDLPVALAAIEALSMIDRPESVPYLVDLLDRAKQPERLDALSVALRRMTGRLYGAEVAKWRKYLAERPAR
jgi:HEAT repeat protein